jgi:4-hydroxyproline epimerase
MASERIETIRVADSHTAGEPTRVVLEGGPPLGDGPLAARRDLFRDRFDHYRRAIVCEPRGWDAMVGALLMAPHAEDCAAGVIFFNNVGYLGMCGHGTIGVVHTLAHLGRLRPGVCRLETPVGAVEAHMHPDGAVSVRNVPSRRYRADVMLEVPGFGVVRGDVAWGGNWFFLAEDHGQELVPGNLERLTEVSWAIRRALAANRITGEDGAEIDHVELTGPSPAAGVNSRNFVLCPGGAYDRSPCGTGTSARVACLAEEGRLAPGEIWRQESILGGVFEASYALVDGEIVPTITGRAHITGMAELMLEPADPFRWGLALS